MKRLIILFLLCLFVFPSTAQEENTEAPTIPRPLPTATLESGGLVLNRYFTSLVQGQVGILQLSGENIQEARILFRSREYPFHDSHEDGWYGLLLADIDAQARDYPFAVIARLNDGTNIEFAGTITVESSGFTRQIFDVPANLAYLIDPVVERNEYARLDSLMDEARPERLWTAQPWTASVVNIPFSSNFGQYRILNDTVQTRHTGWDQSVPAGTPIGAMQAGEVVFAGQLDIRGNYVLIDHGWGVYSGYAHLSQIDVVRGQRLQQGEIMGLSGTTGRSSGAHLHWEIAVNGEWIDGALFLEMWLP